MTARQSTGFYLLPYLFLLLASLLLFDLSFHASRQPTKIVCLTSQQNCPDVMHRCHHKKNISYENFLETVLKSKTIYKQLGFTNPDSNSWPNDITEIFRGILIEWLRNIKRDTIRIVEVGSYKGKSAIAMIRVCEELFRSSNKCSLIAIDTWLGAGLYYENNDDFALARNRFGASQLYEKFMGNVIRNNLTNAIVPLRLPSIDGAHVLFCYSIKADFIYIDAGHDYWSAYNDIKMYYRVLDGGGYMFGDDYHLEDVKQAVNRFAEEIGVMVYMPEKRTWIITKPQA